MILPHLLLALLLTPQATATTTTKTHSAPSASQKSSPAPPSKASTAEQRTAAHFESIKKDPLLLRGFLLAMPKGGDLHHHLSGSIYAESYIRWAAEMGMCVNKMTMAIVPTREKPSTPGAQPPCDDPATQRPVSDSVKDVVLYRDMIDALSMRNFHGTSAAGEYHFFDTFLKFGAVSGARRADMLAEVMHRAALQNDLYIETMVSFDAGAAGRLADNTPYEGDFAVYREKLLAGGLKELVSHAVAYIDQSEDNLRRKLACDTKDPDPGCKVTIRYIAESYRLAAPHRVFAQFLFSMELAAAEPRVVGINFVQPEDGLVSMRDYDIHMRMLDYLHAQYPKVRIALHAGELGYTQVPPEALGTHIPKAIDTGHAERIGHGADVMYYPDAPALLKEMAQKKIAVEINLSSNDWILGERGAQQPLRDYMAAGVPVVLCTDDEGVSRSDLTHEYQRAVEEHGITYPELKRISRNGLEFSFLPEAQKAGMLKKLDAAFEAFEKKW